MPDEENPPGSGRVAATGDSGRTGRVRTLTDVDLIAVRELLNQRPLENLFLSSRLDLFGLDPLRLGCPVWGFERDGHLVAVCHAGVNLVPVGADAEALEAFADRVGPRRISQSIMGDAAQVMALFELLRSRWPQTWGRAREVRAHQPLMMIDTEPLVAPDERVRPASMSEFAGYFAAAVAMYTEEVGVSPLDSAGSYQQYVRLLIESGRAFAGVTAGHVWFKSDIGSASGKYCQVQGVWLEPALRGRKISEPAMAQVVRLCRRQFEVVSLYVNDFNTPARRLYERVGFRTVGELATVLY